MPSMRAALSLLFVTAALLAGDPEREALPAKRAGIGQPLALRNVTDMDGTSHKIEGPAVIAMTSTSCPLSRKFAPVLARLSRKSRVIFVDVDGGDSTREFRAFARQHGFAAVLVHDPGRRIARALGARTTTEMFLVDGEETLVYRGAVSDQYGIGSARNKPRRDYLADALNALDAGRASPTPSTSAPGCALATDQPVEARATWHGTIQRIVQNRCMRCHRKGAVAPFALESYEQVDAHAGMIAQTVRKGIMPPWSAAEGHLPLRDEQALPTEQRETLLAWIKSERPKGDPALAPKPPQWPDGWTIGKPDVVLQLPREVPIKAEGRMDYVLLQVPTRFEEERWVRAWEVRPTALDAVHHVLVFALRPGVKRAPGGTRGEFLAAFVPGNGAAVYPDGLAKRIPKGAVLHFQLHYTPNGRATTDRTRIGLRFTDRPRHEIITTGIATTDLRIPAGAANHVEHAALPVKRAIRLLALMPHMHYRGRAFRYEWIAPDNTRTTLLDVPRYDFNWQLSYALRDPLDVPAGSLLRVTGRYDNSEDTPLNPDPTREVRWGEQSDDEMLIGYAEYYVPGVRAGATVPRLRETPASKAVALLDRNGDGFIALAECPQKYRPTFAQLDADNDGKVSWSELQPVNRSAR